jgi:hypothetical protein
VDERSELEQQRQGRVFTLPDALTGPAYAVSPRKALALGRARIPVPSLDGDAASRRFAALNCGFLVELRGFEPLTPTLPG